MSQFRRTAKLLIQTIPKWLRRLGKSLSALMQTLVNWVLHRSFVLGRRSARGTAGFILPTAVMVILVVSLLTTAIVIRSTDRAKNASNYRVNQVTLNASLPAIERAKQKINDLFSDPNLPQGAPSDISLYNVLKQSNYTLNDETRLRIAFDMNRPNGIQHSNDIGDVDDEIVTTAWRYPVDTDNNGRYDSFTLYGIYFRTPQRSGTGFDRARMPLDARTAPQDNSGLTGFCAAAAGTAASLVGSDGWFKSGANLKKSFYVYTATVPITNPNEARLIPGGRTNYEEYSGNQGFTGLEYQQDRVKVPFGNNAVVYEDDLDLFSGTELNINGRIVANSNLLAASFVRDGRLRLYQVSSDESCFYEEENGKILVGGNVGFGPIGAAGLNVRNVTVDLFQGKGVDPRQDGNGITNTNKSVNNTPDDLAYNNQAYEERIQFLVNAILDPDNNPATPSPNPQTVNNYPNCRSTTPSSCTVNSRDPEAVKESIARRLNGGSVLDPNQVREEELEKWFRDRTRRVPYEEIPFGSESIPPGVTVGNVLRDYGTDRLRPRDEWTFPTTVTNGGKTGSASTGGRTQLALKLEQLPATEPEARDNEERTGDRILTGNNLPALFYNSNTQEFEANVGEFTEETGQQLVGNNTKWKKSGGTGDSTEDRYRKSQVAPGVDVGQADRDGSWETDAAEVPKNPLDDKGGLRIVTGAGVYLTANPANMGDASKVVWPDWMPAIPGAAQPGIVNFTSVPWLNIDGNTNGISDPLEDALNNERPFLRMRATAVYHYRYDNDGNRDTAAAPIACVSSYYDPTTRDTARNLPTLPAIASPAKASGQVAQEPATFTPGPGGQSNNGITYAVGQTSQNVGVNDPQLLQQAELVYPNGRLVNPLLREALTKPFAQRTLAENGAIDSTLCALQILRVRGVVGPSPATRAGGQLPHGAIQEVAFLDSREVKKLEDDRGNPNEPTYDDTSYSSQPQNDSQSDFIRTKTIRNNPNRRSEYDLPVELRQPMEIRATAIDLDLLRRQRVSARPGGTVLADLPDPEYMLPNSGIVYVTRDDARPDASDKPAQPAGGPINWETLSERELATDRISATDFWLDPTRRPNGVLLLNGKRLARGLNNQFRAEEKGLILVTNLPVYIKAQPPGGTPASPTPGFNIHDHEEFTAPLNPNWGNFYTRTEAQLNRNFACRANDPRLAPDCATGDQWRSVSILSDAMTLLSNTFRFGFRNEGDFDLRNNQVDNAFRNIQIPIAGFPRLNTAITPAEDSLTANGPNTPSDFTDSIEEQRLFNGFFDNNFVTNGLSSGNGSGVFTNVGAGYTNGRYTDANYVSASNPPLYSSYFNNFITPIQRRQNRAAAEYVMEICRKLPVSECTPDDWVVGVDVPPLNAWDPVIPDENLRASEIPAGTPANRLFSGTTALPPLRAEDQRFPRRVAFLRTINPGMADDNDLILSGGLPVPFGIEGGGNVGCYTYSGTANSTGGLNCNAFAGANRPRDNQANVLMYRTVNTIGNPYNTSRGQWRLTANRPLFLAEDLVGIQRAGTNAPNNRRKAQPLLVPILQIHTPDNNPDPFNDLGARVYGTHWLPQAPNNGTTFNLIFAAGDSPGRTDEFNGALSNFPRFMENWAVNISTAVPVNIQGSFIQLKRSAYATAPYWQLLDPTVGVNGIYTGVTRFSSILFEYPQSYRTATGKYQNYEPPERRWGFDVGLLSQLPDAFAKKLNRNSTEEPNEYYREARRDDDWIQALLCAVQYNQANVNTVNAPAVNENQRPSEFCRTKSFQPR